jgi:signal transduction histidine kinase
MRTAALARADQLAETRRRIGEVGYEQRRALAAELTGRTDRHLAALDEALTWPAHGERAIGGSGTARLLRAEVAAAREQVRELVHGIRPTDLEAGGLAVALPALARRSGLPVEVCVEVDRLRPAVESAAYFVCAEALTNVAKHARAGAVVVQARRLDDVLAIDVTDDGQGGADPRGSGLRGLADRIQALGGTL